MNGEIALYQHVETIYTMSDMCVQVDVLTRMYPCTECANHFGEIVK